MNDSSKRFRERLEYLFKDFTSITILKSNYNPYAYDIKHMAFIELLVNENEYIADTLIHGDILKKIKEKDIHNRIIIQWI